MHRHLLLERTEREMQGAAERQKHRGQAQVTVKSKEHPAASSKAQLCAAFIVAEDGGGSNITIFGGSPIVVKSEDEHTEFLPSQHSEAHKLHCALQTIINYPAR